MMKRGTTFYASRLPVGTRVTWRREVYRMPYSKRPIDSGEVVANDGTMVSVRPDHAPETTVLGPAAVFLPVAP